MPLPLLIQFILCPVVLISLLSITAPYGRHFKRGWGPGLPNRVAWILMEFPAIFVIAFLVTRQPAGTSSAVLFPLGFWMFHYCYRTFVFPLMMRPSGRTFPASLVLFAIAFNVLNGYNNGEALLDSSRADPAFPGTSIVIGTGLFVAGFLIHAHSDFIIRNLRKPGDTGYAIPRGGMFRWVSSPQYLGEIIQWTGWAVLTWSLAGLAFALFTICNLVPRAVSNQRWYHERFVEYPGRRKILIPGVF